MWEYPEKNATFEGWDRTIHFMRTRSKLLMLISFAAMFLYGALLPKAVPYSKPFTSQSLQTSHTLALTLFSYANDHGGKYPDGKSSTEVFQQLLNETYVSDPGLFYFPMTGKVKPSSSDGKYKLKPENVCFDVTSGVTEDSPEELPLVYMTGFRVKYEPGAPAIREATGFKEGIAVGYKSNGSRFIRIGPDDTIPGFIPATFDAKGRVYRQLTPDGR